MIIPFHRPNIPKNWNDLFLDSIQSGWLTTGSIVKNFEGKLSNYLSSEYVIALNSCTGALHLALLAKGFGEDYKFIAPTFTFVSTIECGCYVGMKPILIDSQKDGFLIDLNKVEDILKRDTSIKAIIPVHYAGESLNLKSLYDIAEKYGIFILEDAAHALESVSNIGKVGNTNYAAAFSFYANKNLTTAGEGGIVSTNDLKLAKKIKRLSLHGMTKDGWNRFQTYGKWEYDIVDLGYKYNMTDISASFGLWQLNNLEHWKFRRIEIANQYEKAFKKIDGLILPDLNKGHARHLFVIQLDLPKWSISRNEFIEKMNNRGIGLAVHYKPIHMLSFYRRKYDYKFDEFPRANKLFESVISLPIYPLLTDRELSYIIEAVFELSEKYIK